MSVSEKMKGRTRKSDPAHDGYPAARVNAAQEGP